MITINIIKICLVILLLSITGCVTIPSEAPKLSQELGNRISSIESANIILLKKYFDHKRDDVDRFVTEQWVPTFAEKVFSSPKIAKIWDTVVKENNKAMRLEFIVGLGPKLQEKINEKRTELIAPLDNLERNIESKIRTEYSQARALNNSISSFLLSASKVTENRDRYLEMAGLTDEKIGNIIQQTDEAVTDLLSEADDLKEKVEKGKEFRDKLRSLNEKLQ